MFQCFRPFRGTKNAKMSFWYWVWGRDSKLSGKQGQARRKALQGVKSVLKGKPLAPLCSVSSYQQFSLISAKPDFLTQIFD